MSDWSPGGNRAKKRRKEKWQQAQQKKYIESLSTIQYRALRKAIAEGVETKPPEATLSTWENLKRKGYDWIGRMREQVRGK